MIRTTVGRALKSPAIAKAVTILDDLAHSNELGAISAIARRTGMAKSSVADICSALSALGLLSRGRDGRYLLGRHIVELARGLVGGRRLIEVFAEACDAAPECRDETVTLSILDGSDIVIIAVRHGRATLPVSARIGLRLPAWATASGRCFLSVLGADDVAEILTGASTTSAGVAGRLPSTSSLMAELTAQEREGYFVDDEFDRCRNDQLRRRGERRNERRRCCCGCRRNKDRHADARALQARWSRSARNRCRLRDPRLFS